MRRDRKPQRSGAVRTPGPVDRRDEGQVVVGRITGVFGVRGWVRVFSDTDPPEKILAYGPWSLGGAPAETYRITEGATHGRGVIVHLAGIDDRDQARGLIGSTIRVPRARFGKTGRGEYYWFDLLGLEVVTEDGRPLGRIEQLLETGANDVMVVRGDRRILVPFILHTVVKSVDQEHGIITVSWDSDY